MSRTEQRWHGLVDFARVVTSAWPELPSLTVVDVGAGDGWLGDCLGARRYVSCDRVYAGSAIIAEGAALPFRDRSFDLALCKQVLPHAEDPLGVCREVWRVARLGAVVRQDLPTGTWPTKMISRIDAVEDVLPAFPDAGSWSYDGHDLVVRR